MIDSLEAIQVCVCFDRLITGSEKFANAVYIAFTVHPSYSERVGAAKIVHNNRVFTINVFNLTIN